ncbi:hypothetical protein RIF29_39961 [Crotalaria pallida]|uniref:Uncharacterized protein n=1 Tax=Crotalaria pallida TaxID=3830 RepID=A0AAN9E3V0_CROPI
MNGDPVNMGDGGITSDQAIILIADNPQGVKDINGVAPHNEIFPVKSPYGPWMMVKKSIRRKDTGRQFATTPNAGNTDRQQTNLGNQSRFAALEIEKEKEKNPADVDMEISNQGCQQSLPLVGDNPTSHYSKVPLESTVEKAQSSKGKEIEILHKMKLLQQQGVNGIDGFVTQVHLAARDASRMGSNRTKAYDLHQKDPKPPDIEKTDFGSPAMEIDEELSVVDGIDQQKSENHSET